jgi:hypothetical protein
VKFSNQCDDVISKESGSIRKWNGSTSLLLLVLLLEEGNKNGQSQRIISYGKRDKERVPTPNERPIPITLTNNSWPHTAQRYLLPLSSPPSSSFLFFPFLPSQANKLKLSKQYIYIFHSLF